MILIFGGTTEGRHAVGVADQSGKPFYYSTKGKLQEVSMVHGIRLKGTMDAKKMAAFCTENNIRLIIDAAHPFAEELHRIIDEVSQKLIIAVVRYERIYPGRSPDIHWCSDFAEAIEQLNTRNVKHLLALTGVQTIGKLKPFWEKHETWFRILEREESLTIAQKHGFPQKKLIYYQPDNDEYNLIASLAPDAIILKESGESGGFNEKVNAALAQGIKVFAIIHPQLSTRFEIVDGPHGLRRAIERHLPDFFPLRTGLTTGSCATAAATAAFYALNSGKNARTVTITLPGGEHITVDIAELSIESNVACCTVVKDSGDDADVTHGMRIVAKVRWIGEEISNSPVICIKGGEGIGRVTLPGLGLEIGEAAINESPKKMITENIKEAIALSGKSTQSVEITLSVPDGEKVAQRTFNPRLGIVGGISIIGTSGIIQPFSIEAFISSIRKSMAVAKATGASQVVISSGAKSERFLHACFPDLPNAAFVHYGNYIGETIKIAAEFDIRKLTLALMIGKAVKLADGHLDTHSKKTTMNKAFLSEIARQSGCSSETLARIAQMTLARELWEIIPEANSKRFFSRIVTSCDTYCIPLLPQGKLNILLIRENGEIFQTDDVIL